MSSSDDDSYVHSKGKGKAKTGPLIDLMDLDMDKASISSKSSRKDSSKTIVAMFPAAAVKQEGNQSFLLFSEFLLFP